MKQSANGKPLPEVCDLTRPFWEGAAQDRLMMQKCKKCGAANFYPKACCVECGARALEWVEAKRTGVVYSYTTASTVMMNLPGWKGELPVTLCLIDIDDGPRMYAQLTDCDPADIRFGMRVAVHFETLEGGIGIPKFRPA